MSFGHDLVALLLEMNVINREDAERRIRILAARILDPRATKWFQQAGRWAISNFDKILDKSHNPTPIPRYTINGFRILNSYFGPTEPQHVPTQSLSKQALAMLYARGPHGAKGPYWWQNHEPVPEEDPLFTDGRERATPAADDPRFAGMSAEEIEAFRADWAERNAPRKLSHLKRIDAMRRQLAAYQRQQQQQPPRQTEALRWGFARRLIEAAGDVTEIQQKLQDILAKLKLDATASSTARPQIYTITGATDGLLTPKARTLLKDAGFTVNSTNVTDGKLSVRYTPKYETDTNLASTEDIQQGLRDVLAKLRMKVTVSQGERPHLFTLSGVPRSILGSGAKQALKDAGFVIDDARITNGNLTVRYVPRYQTDLHKPTWQARLHHTLTLPKAMAQLRVKQYTVLAVDGGSSDEFAIRAAPKDLEKIQSAKGVELLSRAGYVVDYTRRDYDPDDTVPVRKIDAEFEPYAGSDPKHYRPGQHPPVKGWKEIRAPRWSAMALQNKEDTAFFKPNRAEERHFWKMMEWLVHYLNTLHRDTQDTSTATGRLMAERANQLLDELAEADESDLDRFMDMLARAEKYVKKTGDIIADFKKPGQQTVAKYGPYELVRLNKPEAVFDFSGQPTRWYGNTQCGWCTGHKTNGLSNSAHYLGRGNGRMYGVLRDGDPFALLTPNTCFHDINNAAVTDPSYFDKFIPLFDEFPLEFFDHSEGNANMEAFRKSALKRKPDRK